MTLATVAATMLAVFRDRCAEMTIELEPSSCLDARRNASAGDDARSTGASR